MTMPPAETDAEAILTTLRRAWLLPVEPGWQLRAVPGGLNSRVFVAIAPDGAPTLTVRQARPALDELLDHEARVLAEIAANAASGACAPHGALRVGKLLVHAFVPGAPAPLAGAGANELAALARCLAAVHAHPRAGYTLWPALNVQAGTLWDAFQARLATLGRYAAARPGGALAGRIAPLRATLRAAVPPDDAGWETRGFALIHGDLSAGNIIWNDARVALIDWEYARAGDPAEDLAYLLGEQPLPVPRVAELTRAYVAAGGEPRVVARMDAWQPLVLLDAALWWADYLAALGANRSAGRAIEVEARLERAWAALGASQYG